MIHVKSKSGEGDHFNKEPRIDQAIVDRALAKIKNFLKNVEIPTDLPHLKQVQNLLKVDAELIPAISFSQATQKPIINFSIHLVQIIPFRPWKYEDNDKNIKMITDLLTDEELYYFLLFGIKTQLDLLRFAESSLGSIAGSSEITDGALRLLRQIQLATVEKVRDIL